MLIKKTSRWQRTVLFKIGGPARLFVQPADRAQLCRAVALCKAQGVRYYLLGNGSNILFADEGYNGVVLDISSMQDTVEVHGTQLTAGAGVRLSAHVQNGAGA